MKELSVAALAGDENLSRKLDSKISCLHRDLFIESNPAPAKWALQKMGKIQSGIRLPLVELSAKGQVVIEKSLKQANIL